MTMWWPWSTSAQLRAIQASLNRIERKVDSVATDQETLAAIAQQIEADVTGENAALATVQAGIAKLQEAAANGQPLDFTEVNQAVTDLGTTLASIQQTATTVPS